MTGRPWYAFYPDDYERDAGGLTYVEDSAYRRMLDMYYKTGEPLPLDHDLIFRACKAMKKDERGAILKMLGLFFITGDDGYHQLRADEEIVKSAALSQKRSEIARNRHAKAVQTACKAGAIAGAIADTATSTSTKAVAAVDEDAANQLNRLNRLLGFSETDFGAYLSNIRTLAMLKTEGCDFEQHILPAAEQASRSKRAKTLAYIVPKARELRDAKAIVASMPLPFENTDETGWRNRLRAFRDKALWGPKWGPKPGEIDCKCPAAILEQDKAA